MRNLQECQAEVLRRSEKRIKERKKRRAHILMVCIPLGLCLTVFGSFLLPDPTLKKSTDGCLPETLSTHLYAGCGDVLTEGLLGETVTVSGNGLSNIYTSVEDVQRIIDFIDKIKGDPEPTEIFKWEVMNSLEQFIASFNATTDGGCKTEGYKILIHHGDGSTTEYLLIGSVLIDQSNQKEFHMSQDSYYAFKDILGIPLY